jgi:hypothetical protein
MPHSYGASFAVDGRRGASNRDAVKLYWKISAERGEPELAAPALEGLLREELRRGAHREAAGLWRTFTDRLPQHRIDVPTLLQLAPAIAQAEGKQGTLELLGQCVKHEDLTGSMAYKVAQWSAELDPDFARAAAKRALDTSELDAPAREELKILLAALSPDEAKIETKTPAPSVFYEESDRSAFGESGDLSATLNESFPDGAMTQAVPIALDSASITLRYSGEDQYQRIECTRVRGISAVGVRGLSPKPVVVIDLLVGGGDSSRPLSVIRLRGDKFDPRKLFPNATSISQALKEMVAAIQSHSCAKLLADITSKPPRPNIIFEDLDDYHEKILRPAAKLLD